MTDPPADLPNAGRGPHIRWLPEPTVIRVRAFWDDGDMNATIYPGWVDVRDYPQLDTHTLPDKPK